MQVKSGGTTTTTYYPGPSEEQTGSTLTKYYSVKGLPLALSVGGTISYLASDSLHSVSEAFSSSGVVTAQQLYSPYGSARYSNGTMPTSKGFTGQRGDGATGLDYYNARYYDPVLGQFTSGDSAAAGLNRYAYAGDSPETNTDPSGHLIMPMGGNTSPGNPAACPEAGANYNPATTTQAKTSTGNATTTGTGAAPPGGAGSGTGCSGTNSGIDSATSYSFAICRATQSRYQWQQ
jgi:RHS repeat-associated protein